MTDPYIQINATKIEFFDNEVGAIRTLKGLSDGTYIAWAACTAPTFVVSSYDNGSGGQPATVSCRIRRSNNLCFVEYIGTGVKAGTDNLIQFSFSVFPTPALIYWGLCIGYGTIAAGGAYKGLTCVRSDASNFALIADANITDNTVIDPLSFTLCYEV